MYARSGSNPLLLLFVVIFGISILTVPLYTYGTVRSAEVTINGLDHKIIHHRARRNKAGTITDKYLIFTANHGVFENVDSLLWLKFNSSDVQSACQEGDRCRIKYYGWRVPLFSWYPNIVTAERIESTHK